MIFFSRGKGVWRPLRGPHKLQGKAGPFTHLSVHPKLAYFIYPWSNVAHDSPLECLLVKDVELPWTKFLGKKPRSYQTSEKSVSGPNILSLPMRDIDISFRTCLPIVVKKYNSFHFKNILFPLSYLAHTSYNTCTILMYTACG